MLRTRDPFSRTELHSERIYTPASCAWCGNARNTRDGARYLYRFRIETDAGRIIEDNHLFCSRECRQTFYD